MPGDPAGEAVDVGQLSDHVAPALLGIEVEVVEATVEYFWVTPVNPPRLRQSRSSSEVEATMNFHSPTRRAENTLVSQ